MGSARLQGAMRMNGVVEVRDYVLWPKDIYGNAALHYVLLALEAGAVINLDIARTVGTWTKMAFGKNGVPTPGLRALGQARTHWHNLSRIDRDVVVPISNP